MRENTDQGNCEYWHFLCSTSVAYKIFVYKKSVHYVADQYNRTTIIIYAHMNGLFPEVSPSYVELLRRV